MSDETVNDRINQVIRWSGFSKAAFADKIGEKRFNINNVTGAKQIGVSHSLLYKIADTFEEIDLDWLIKGKGKMLKVDNEFYSGMSDERIKILNAEYSGQITMLRALLKEKEKELFKAWGELEKILKKNSTVK